MSRTLKSWARDSGDRRPRPRFTLLPDLLSMWLTRSRRPKGAPPRVEQQGSRVGVQELYSLNLRRLFSLRVNLEVVGDGSLLGVQRPMIFAVNEAGSLDLQLLRRALPAPLRPASRSLSQALRKRRNVVVFSDDPDSGRLVGEFDTTVAELAHQHFVPIIPVGIVGSYRLYHTLKLRLVRPPKVSVRFGAPLYPSGATIEEVTRQVQARVEHLVGEGDLTWWEVERRRDGGPAVTTPAWPRWRRLWEQAAPRENAGRARRIWR